jgi:hypothetical protein
MSKRESITHVINGRLYRATTVTREIPTPYGGGFISVSNTRWELLPNKQLGLFNEQDL